MYFNNHPFSIRKYKYSIFLLDTTFIYFIYIYRTYLIMIFGTSIHVLQLPYVYILKQGNIGQKKKSFNRLSACNIISFLVTWYIKQEKSLQDDISFLVIHIDANTMNQPGLVMWWVRRSVFVMKIGINKWNWWYMDLASLPT